MKRISAANIINEPYMDIPVVIEMDGKARIKSWYMLRHEITDTTELDLLPVQCMDMVNPIEPLFPCEADPRESRVDPLNTLSQVEVHNLMVQNVDTALLNHAATYVSLSDGESPRYAMVDGTPVYGNLTLSPLNESPRSIVKVENPDQSDERDPFESDSQ